MARRGTARRFLPARAAYLAAAIALGCITMFQAAPLLRAQAGPASTAAPPAFDDLGSAVATSGQSTAIGAAGVNGTGAVYVYVHAGSGWTLQQALADPANVPGDQFGEALAMSGSTLLVGAYSASNGDGRAYVYARSGSRWRLEQTLFDPNAYGCCSFGSALAVDGSTAIVSAVTGPDGGATYIYVRSGYSWVRQARLRLPNPDGTFFGISVAISGTTALITGSDKSGTRRAYLYVRSKAGWNRQAVLTDPGTGNFFGQSAAISGELAIIGAPGQDFAPGSAYAYRRAGSNWTLVSTLTVAGDSGTYGQELAVSGTTAVVGSYIGRDGDGAAFTYHWTGTSWRPQGPLDDPDPTRNGQFGGAVATSGPVIIVGGEGIGNDGAAFFYARSGTTWRHTGSVSDIYHDKGAFKGGSVAVYGDAAVIGASGADDGYGAAFMYSRSKLGWRQSAEIRYPGSPANSGASFGTSVAISGTTAVIGATENGTSEGGAAYIYGRSGGIWYQQAKLPAPAGNSSFFGWSVAISGNIVVVGAPGPNLDSGAVYIYSRTGGTWHLRASIAGQKDDGFNDGFGNTVAVSGNTVVIGASGQDQGEGIVYIYHRTPSGWRKQATVPDPSGIPGDAFGVSVAISGSTMVVGANGVRDRAGAAFVYSRQGSSWIPQALLSGQKGVPGNGFGYSVAISFAGHVLRILAGGLAISGLATGPAQCGRAFEFVRLHGNWREGARLVDAQCRSYDQYGYSVAIYGRNAVIGAPGADRNAGKVYVAKVP